MEARPVAHALEPQVVSVRGKAPFNAPFNILTALHSLTGLQSVGEVAEMFGKSPYTVYRMALKRQIPSFMFGGAVHAAPKACKMRQSSILRWAGSMMTWYAY